MRPFVFDVLRALAPGEFRSGESLAHSLAMSRGSVWHAVRELETAGLEIYKVRGRGYRLAQAISLLDSTSVLSALAAEGRFFSVEIVPSAPSTNTMMLQRAADGAPSGCVIAAEWQTAGRGRFGRAWHAGIGSALTFSLLWRFEHGAAALAGLSLAVGVAVVRALKALGVTGAGVKWPNDVLWQRKKLAGMLIEMQGDALGPSAVVIGIGLNVRLSAELHACIDQPAADMENALEAHVDRNALLARLLKALRDVLIVFAEDGFRPFQREWQSFHLLQGAPVTLTLPDGSSASGIAQGVTSEGALMLATSAGARRFYSGEVSLRPAAGAEPFRSSAATRRTAP